MFLSISQTKCHYFQWQYNRVLQCLICTSKVGCLDPKCEACWPYWVMGLNTALQQLIIKMQYANIYHSSSRVVEVTMHTMQQDTWNYFLFIPHLQLLSSLCMYIAVKKNVTGNYITLGHNTVPHTNQSCLNTMLKFCIQFHEPAAL